MSKTITVPEGMSYVNAFRALWENAKPPSDYNDPDLEATLTTVEKVITFFKVNGCYVAAAGGRLLEANFIHFPELGVSGYDAHYGKGAAKKALDQYNQLPNAKKLDKNDKRPFSEIRVISRL
jgi:hypothetical protein